MHFRNMTGAAGLALALACAAPAQAGYVLSNDNGGDGFVRAGPAPYLFTLFGADNGLDNEGLGISNHTSYTTTATADATLKFNYKYYTDDCCGSYYDPAGYVLNGVYNQVTIDSFEPNTTVTGIISFAVHAGDSYGFYVYSGDSEEGRGELSIAGVPEPASWALMIGGFGLAGAALRTRRRTTATA